MDGLQLHPAGAQAAAQGGELIEDNAPRVRFLDLADQIWRHVERRRIEGSANARGLWDEPTQVFAGTSFAPYGIPSWYHTERVIEVLVAAANVTRVTADRRP